MMAMTNYDPRRCTNLIFFLLKLEKKLLTVNFKLNKNNRAKCQGKLKTIYQHVHLNIVFLTADNYYSYHNNR